MTYELGNIQRLRLDPPVAAAGLWLVPERWAAGLFGAFTYLAGGSLIAIGVAVILGGALSRVGGWFAIVIGIVIVGGYAIFGDMPPFVAYLPTGLLGIVLLPKRSRSDAQRMRMNEGSG